MHRHLVYEGSTGGTVSRGIAKRNHTHFDLGHQGLAQLGSKNAFNPSSCGQGVDRAACATPVHSSTLIVSNATRSEHTESWCLSFVPCKAPPRALIGLLHHLLLMGAEALCVAAGITGWKDSAELCLDHVGDTTTISPLWVALVLPDKLGSVSMPCSLILWRRPPCL